MIELLRLRREVEVQKKMRTPYESEEMGGPWLERPIWNVARCRGQAGARAAKDLVAPPHDRRTFLSRLVDESHNGTYYDLCSERPGRVDQKMTESNGCLFFWYFARLIARLSTTVGQIFTRYSGPQLAQ